MSATPQKNAEGGVATMPIGTLALRAAEKWPDREAIVFPEERHTFAAVAERALAAARSLAALGIRRGDHVGLLLPNCPDFVFAFMGAQLLGAVIVPINTRYRSTELAHVIDFADVKVLLTTDVDQEHVDYVARLNETFPDLAASADPRRLDLAGAPGLETIVLLGDGEVPGLLPRRAFEALEGGPDDEAIRAGAAEVGVDDVALILFTSGTTALPKGCMLSHDAVVGCWLSVGDRLGIGSGDRVFDPLPCFHMAGTGPMLLAFERGATILNMGHFEAPAALDMIERDRATWLYTIFPPITMALVKDPTFAARDLSAVRAVMDVAPPETLAVISRAFDPIPHLQGPFGMTEAGGAITCSRLEDTQAERIGTTGRPVARMEVKVIDPETGADLGTDAEGELIVRGGGLFAGYYKDPQSTAAVVDPDGWLHSGDLGSIDADGRVTYVGRLKEMLKVGGENVAPTEVESHISGHPDVKLVQVIGVPDERLDEVPAAFVELVPGATLDADDVIAWCRGNIASFKVPRHVRFVTESEWPMSATKVQKNVLRERLVADLESGS
jgi:acyl-CoA synthetase (AMP-forming)/AMP-acid ligase II